MATEHVSERLTEKLSAAFAAVDNANREDEDCFLYGRRMSAELAELSSDPSDELALAVRAQHIRRFEIPRSSYPTGLVGYKKWRASLGRFHAELAIKIAGDAGFSETAAARVGELVRKQRLGIDPEVQVLEDVACVVFVRYQLDAFSKSHDQDKTISVLAKTMAKMSRRGLDRVGALELPKRLSELIAAASALQG